MVRVGGHENSYTQIISLFSAGRKSSTFPNTRLFILPFIITKSAKMEATTGDRCRRREGLEKSEKRKIVKKERQSKSGIGSVRSQESPIQEEKQGIDERRAIRSEYHLLVCKNARVDSDKFDIIINEVDSLHQKVKKPREQIADAEALLKLAEKLYLLLKPKFVHGGVSPPAFVSALISGFGKTSLGIDADENT